MLSEIGKRSTRCACSPGSPRECRRPEVRCTLWAPQGENMASHRIPDRSGKGTFLSAFDTRKKALAFCRAKPLLNRYPRIHPIPGQCASRVTTALRSPRPVHPPLSRPIRRLHMTPRSHIVIHPPQRTPPRHEFAVVRHRLRFVARKARLPRSTGAICSPRFAMTACNPAFAPCNARLAPFNTRLAPLIWRLLAFNARCAPVITRLPEFYAR